MKKNICFLLVLSFILSFYACNTAEPPVDTDAPSATFTEPRPSMTEETELTETSDNTDHFELTFEYDMGITEIPMMFIFTETTVNPQDAAAYKVIWDLEAGFLSTPEHLYDADFSGDYTTLLDAFPDVWTGNSNYIGGAIEISNHGEINYTQVKNAIPYGRCYYDQSDQMLYALNDNGSCSSVTVPSVPDDVWEAAGHTEAQLHMPAMYGTVLGDTAFVAYISYYSQPDEDGKWREYSDLFYCVYPIAQPEAGQWSVVHLPEETHPSIAATAWKGALIDSKLYLPSEDDLLVIDITKGAWSFLGIMDGIWAMCGEGATTLDPKWNDKCEVTPLGAYNGILIASLTLFDSNEQEHNYMVAIRGDQILGVLELTGRNITIYNQQLLPTSTPDLLAESTGHLLVFPKDD